MVGERISKNVAQLVKGQRARGKQPEPWSVEEACTFLENAQLWRDYLYGAYSLILVLDLRKGEVLGPTWSDVNVDTAKTEASEAVLPLPDICLTALCLRQKEQQAAKERADDLWTESDMVFTTRHGTPVEPRSFTRGFDRCCEHAGVRRIRVHDTRHTCASLLAALDVHPRIAMQILRHSEVYTPVLSADTRRALRKLGKALGRQQGGGREQRANEGQPES